MWLPPEISQFPTPTDAINPRRSKNPAPFKSCKFPYFGFG